MTSHPNRSKKRPPTAPGASPRAAEIRALRERHGLTQEGLAEACSPGAITVRSVQGWETDERRCPPATWRYILAQLGELKLPERVGR